jgi:hypothetical protein
MKKSASFFTLTLLFVFCSSFLLHKFYVSVTQIHFIPEKKAVQITQRYFIDDLNAALEKKHSEKFYLDSAKETMQQNKKLEEYVLDNLEIKINGKLKKVNYLARETDADVFVFYLTVSEVSKIQNFEIKNTLLFDYLTEQQHITHTQINGVKKSFLLTSAQPVHLLK